MHQHPGPATQTLLLAHSVLYVSPCKQRKAGEPNQASLLRQLATLESRALGHGVREKVLLPYLVRLEPLHYPNVLPQQVVQRPVVVEGEGAFFIYLG